MMAREIKTKKGNTHFIVITGSSDQIHMDKFRKIGVIDYIVKPIVFSTLFAIIAKCIGNMNLA